MKISELINHLEEIKEKHGDCNVFEYYENDRNYDAKFENIIYEKEGWDGLGPGLYL